MSKDILSIEPKALWTNFYNLCQIPHPSKHESQIIAFVKSFGENLGLETTVDKVGNVIIRKPATKGCENKKGVVLQAHLDMVPQANSDSNHNFETDPITTYIDGDWVTADGTTLGADNGIGAATIMAILESKDIKHGNIEALFTIDEETGMTGAFNLEPNILKGDILINTDSEDEGELYVGCAGGADGNIAGSYHEKPMKASHSTYKIFVSGLKGGHSGVDIAIGRANSNLILFRFLRHATDEFRSRIISVSGGSLRNAIPRESTATISLHHKYEEELLTLASNFESLVNTEFADIESGITIKVTPDNSHGNVMKGVFQNRLINSILSAPNGVIKMSEDMEGLVETSTNLAIVKVNNGEIGIKCLIRSSNDKAKEKLKSHMQQHFEFARYFVAYSGEYSGWQPNMKSDILKTMQGIYKEMYGVVPEIRAIHAGLECGILGANYPNWDMISFGPTIKFPHSPDEKVHIESVQKFHDFFVKTLENIPE